jgi:methyl-accepting chemotaxis protein
MGQQMKLGTKLLLGFGAVAVITLIVGIVGYYGAVKGEQSVDEIGAVRLPSINSTLIMSEAQTAVDSVENALLSRAIDLKTRQEKYIDFADIWKRAENAWKIYEPLPQTDEEAKVWKAFVPAWEKWKKDHQAYVALSMEYDTTVDAQQLGDKIYVSMARQALENNAVTFGKAEDILNEIVEIYRVASDTEAYLTKVDVLTVYSLMTISEAQTAIDSSENALLDRSSDMALRQAQYDRISGAWQRVADAWKIYEPLEQTPKEAALWKEFVSAWNTWKKDHEAFVAFSKQYDDTVKDYIRGEEIYTKLNTQALVTNAVTFGEAEKLLNRIVEINQEVAAHEVAAAHSQAVFVEILAIVASLLGVVLAMGLGFMISRGINRSLTRITLGMSEGADQVASASSQVSSSSQSMAEGASEQAASIEETSSSMEEMSSMTKQNAENAGFAVVADEVRNLAMRAADAAKNTAQLIEGTVKKVNDGSKLVSDTSEAFGKVAESAQKVGTLVSEITQASREQSNGIDQVNIAISEMDKVVQQNAANAEESASASEEMNAQAEQLKDYVSELVLMVTGKTGQGQGSYDTRPVRSAPAYQPKKAAPAKRLAPRKTSEVRPDQMIPFDDDENFKNF